MQRVVFVFFVPIVMAGEAVEVTAAHHQHSCKDDHEVQFNSLLCSSQVVWLFKSFCFSFSLVQFSRRYFFTQDFLQLNQLLAPKTPKTPNMLASKLSVSEFCKIIKTAARILF